MRRGFRMVGADPSTDLQASIGIVDSMQRSADVALIDGVYRHRLVEAATPLVDDPEHGALARAAIATCQVIDVELAAGSESARIGP